MAEHVINYLQGYKREHPEATTVELTPEQEVELGSWCRDHAGSRIVPIFQTEDHVDTIMSKREIYGMHF